LKEFGVKDLEEDTHLNSITLSTWWQDKC